jgi:hypothetical protein
MHPVFLKNRGVPTLIFLWPFTAAKTFVFLTFRLSAL